MSTEKVTKEQAEENDKRWYDLGINIDKLRYVREMSYHSNFREVFIQADSEGIQHGFYEILNEVVKSFDEYASTVEGGAQ